MQSLGESGVHHFTGPSWNATGYRWPDTIGLEPSKLGITTVTGECARMWSKGSLQVTFASHTIDHKFWLADIQDPFIIGLDLLAKWEAVLTLPRTTLYLGSEAVMLLHTGEKGLRQASSPGPNTRAPSMQSPPARVKGVSTS